MSQLQVMLEELCSINWSILHKTGRSLHEDAISGRSNKINISLNYAYYGQC